MSRYVLSASGDLWASDGTTAGTSEILSGIDPTSIIAIGGKVLFARANSLWTTCGTPAATSDLIDLSSAPTQLVAFGSKVSFSDGGGLWVSDDTAAGTSEIGHKAQGDFYLNPTNITITGNYAVFVGTDANGKVPNVG
jgi:hypothetical protein